MSNERFTVELEPVRNWPGQPPIRRLARFIKAALRGYGFKVTDIKTETDEHRTKDFDTSVP